MTIIYGGIELPAPTQEEADWIADNIPVSEVYEFAQAGCADCSSWATVATSDFTHQVSIAIGRLYWPTGASRWAVGHYLATDTDVAHLRGKAYRGAAYLPLTLKITDESGTDFIETDLYMLPPRPLAQIEGEEQLYLLTLVDERFFWWLESALITVTGGTTTWAQLVTSIGTALGISISSETVDAAYLLPSASLSSDYEYLPLLLDAVAVNTGCTVVRAFDGTVTLQTPVVALASQDAQAEKWDKQAGGLFRLGNVRFHDFWSLCPASVRVVYPRTDDGALAATPHSVAVNLADLTVPGFPVNFAGFTGRTKVFNDTATAAYESAVLQNTAQLAALTAKIATDWYAWRGGNRDVNYAGIIPYEPDGMADHALWTYREGRCNTRVQRRPWNDPADKLNHHSTGEAPGSLEKCCDNIYNDGDDTYITNLEITNVTVNNMFLNQVNITFNSNQDNYIVTYDTNFLYIITSIDIEWTGIEILVQENRFYFIKNSGPNLLCFKHNVTSTATYRFWTESHTDLYLYPDEIAVVVYDKTLSRWQVHPLGLVNTKPYTPAQITADQNNYDLGFAQTVFLDLSNHWSITGLVVNRNAPGTTVYLRNTSAFRITLVHNATSTAANRFSFSQATNIVVTSLGWIALRYDFNISRWVLVCGWGIYAAPQIINIIGNDINLLNVISISWRAVIVVQVSGTCTGFAGGFPGAQLRVINNSVGNVVFPHQSGSSTAQNRIFVPGAVSYTLAVNCAVNFTWSTEYNCWLLEFSPTMFVAGANITITPNGVETTIAATATDIKVKVTSADTTTDYLASKTIEGAGITLTVLNPGANEQLEIKSDLTGSGTLNTVAKWTPNGTTLGDSNITDNGTLIDFGGSSVSLSPSNTVDIDTAEVFITAVNEIDITSDSDNITLEATTGNITLISGNATSVNATGASTFTFADTFYVDGAASVVFTGTPLVLGDGTDSVGFFANGGAVRQTVSGDLSDDLAAVVRSLLNAVAAYNLINDTTTD
jgi:hypothetical protein